MRLARKGPGSSKGRENDKNRPRANKKRLEMTKIDLERTRQPRDDTQDTHTYI